MIVSKDAYHSNLTVRAEVSLQSDATHKIRHMSYIM